MLISIAEKPAEIPANQGLNRTCKGIFRVEKPLSRKERT